MRGKIRFQKLGAHAGILMALCIIGLSTISLKALACEAFIEFADSEVQQIVDRALEPDPDFLAISAYRELFCAKRPEVRLYARGMGCKASKSDIRSIAIQDALFDKESIIVEPIVDDSLTPFEREWAIKNRFVHLPVSFRDKQNRCIGIQNNACSPYRYLSIYGEKVEFVNQQSPNFLAGQFSLNDDCALEGHISSTKIEIDMPARILLD